MNYFRNVNDDILKEWINFREENLLCKLNNEDKKHKICFEDIAEKILRNVPKENKKYVEKQLKLLDGNFVDYVSYWCEKYYRCGFIDGVQLISQCFK